MMDAGKPAKCKIRQGEALYDGGGSLLEALLEEKGIQDDERGGQGGKGRGCRKVGSGGLHQNQTESMLIP